MEIDKKRRHKSVLMGIWVLACIVMLLFFAGKNPSKKESSEHLSIMNEDMRASLVSGGEVYSISANAKYGGVLLYVNLMAVGWSSDLVKKYQITLLHRGWRNHSEGTEGISLCKDGMLARIGFIQEIDSSRGQSVKVYEFSMKYGGDTIKMCGGTS